MTRSGVLLLGLTAIIGGLAGLLTFAIARFFEAARTIAKDTRSAGGENALMTSAMQDALGRLRVQERAMAARACETARRSSAARSRWVAWRGPHTSASPSLPFSRAACTARSACSPT